MKFEIIHTEMSALKHKVYMSPDRLKAILVLDICENKRVLIEEHDYKGSELFYTDIELFQESVCNSELIPADDDWKNLILARKV